MSGYTPGPWRTSRSTPSLIEGQHHGETVLLAQALEPQGSASVPEMWANAHLIAQAPAFYAAAETILLEHAAYQSEAGEDMCLCETCEAFRPIVEAVDQP